MFRKIFLLFIGLAAAVYFLNASWLATPSENAAVKLIAHRGVHQTFEHANLGRDTCTASRIHPPAHEFLENTLPSMDAAFAAGAHVVELDVHPTSDGHFAVFHDWTLDCRTNGSGVTREHSLADLKALDAGYGYTADDGLDYPFRGAGQGLIPSLNEVLTRFPGKRFLINFKSRDTSEADRLMALLDNHPEWRTAVWGVYGGPPPTLQAKALMPDLRAFTRQSIKACLLSYAALGWSGYVPEDCRNTVLLIPSDYASWFWGWPHRFVARMQAHDTTVILAGPLEGSGGIDGPGLLPAIPERFSGYVWTNKIEWLGPRLKRNALP